MQYNHSEFVNCRDIASFAKIYAFKDNKGNILGRNKVFAILRLMGIMDKHNVPYQSYMKHFKTLDKSYFQGDKKISKILVFVTPDGQAYLANKINDYLERCEDLATKKKQKVVHQEEKRMECKEVKCSSPLDFSKEDALRWLQSLPEFLKDKGFAVKVREKWGFDC